MMSSSVHTRSLRSTVQALLKLQAQSIRITQPQLADAADLTVRHIDNCLRGLRAQSVVSWERDTEWRGTGVRYLYTVDTTKAQELGYIDPEFLQMLSLRQAA